MNKIKTEKSINSMSFEQRAYELSEIWDDDWFANEDFERFEFILSLLNKDIKSILDVGCGNGLFINKLMNNLHTYKDLKKVSVVDRSYTALNKVREDVEKKQSDIISLPYPDSSFEVVTCLEVLEHLPIEVYLKALEEISRVAKSTIIIAVPFEEDLKSALVSCGKCQTSYNPDFHMRAFDKQKISNLFNSKYFKVKSIGYVGLSLKLPIFARRLKSKVFSKKIPAYAICPVCGFNINEKLSHMKRERVNITSNAISLIRKFFPKKPRWIVAVYEKLN